MKKIYRLFGVPVWSVEQKLEKNEVRLTAPINLTAADNGGDTTSQAMQVYDEDVFSSKRAGF